MGMFDFDFNLRKLVNYTVQIVCLAITVFSLVFVAWPQYKAYQEALPLLAEKQAKNEQMSAFVRYLQSLSDFQDKLFANMGLAKQAIPENDDAPFFLDQILQIGKASSVSVESLTFGGLSAPVPTSNRGGSGTFMRFQPEEGENLDNVSATQDVDRIIDETIPGSTSTVQALPSVIPPQEFIAQFGIKGTYATTRDFLSKLEQARRLVDITSISVNTDEESGSSSVPVSTVPTAGSTLDNGKIYLVSLLVSGFYMKDPDVSMVGPELLAQQKDLESIVKLIEGMTYYEPQSSELIELNIGRLNPFDEKASAALEEEVTGTGSTSETEDTGISAQ